MLITITDATVTAADAPTRTMGGLVAPWGAPGNTSAGRLTLRKGSIRIPEDLRRVKLVDYHQTPPQAIGYATHAELTETGLVMAFQLGSTDAASHALVEASEGLRDAFSVELADVTQDGSDVTDSLLTAVALVPIPAFADARVTSVAAAHQERESTMSDTTSPDVAAAETATIQVTGPIVTEAPADPAAEAANATQVAASAAVAQIMAAMSAQTGQTEGRPAAAPASLQGHAGIGQHSNAEVAAALAQVYLGTARPDAMAALSDITNTNVYTTVGQASYVGRLWEAVSYERRYVPLLRPGTLTSWKVTGWKWGVRPTVDDYAGDKAAIPSNSPTVVPASTTASRLAGGHDLDRKFKDFGDTEFLDAYLQAMGESYAVKSDAKALAFIIASATAGDATASGANALDGIVSAAAQLEEETDGMQADYFLVNRADLRDLGGITESDKLAYLDLFGVDFAKIKASNAVTAGTVYAGVTGAGTFYELPGSPIRVEALDIANGGVDEALFGYYATLLHDARGIIKVALTA
jgi:hypothetical protein